MSLLQVALCLLLTQSLCKTLNKAVKASITQVKSCSKSGKALVVKENLPEAEVDAINLKNLMRAFLYLQGAMSASGLGRLDHVGCQRRKVRVLFHRTGYHTFGTS